MGQTLTNGIYLPNEGERNCYSGLAANWNAVDTLKGNYSLHAINVDIHVTAAEKETWNSKADASALTAHTGDTTIHVTSADKQAWDGHVADSVKHVTAEDKAKWDAVTSKADDSDVVHKSGNETIGGAKIFTNNNMIKTPSPKVLLINTSQTGNTAPSSNTASFFRFDGGTVNNFGGVQCDFLTTGENRLTNYVKDITTAKLNSIQQRTNSTTAMTVFNTDLIIPSTDGITALGGISKHWSDVYGVNYYYGSNNVEFSNKFVTTDTNQTISGNKTFSSINGVEPSSLSLPSDNSSNVVDISSYITYFDGTLNRYVPPANGWIGIYVNNCTELYMKIDNLWGKNVCRTDAGKLVLLMPVPKGKGVDIQIFATGTLRYARFVPCSGNV